MAAGASPGPEHSTAEEIRHATRAFILTFMARRHGSPADLVRDLEMEIGWPARHCLLPVLDELRSEASRGEPGERKYLLYTLSDGAVRAALLGDGTAGAEHQSSLDELFRRSHRYRRSKQFAEAVNFIARFRDYSPFNTMLVYLQNPLTTYFATASHWQKAFGRTIKEEARGMIILAPRTPVLLVFDIADTEGPPLPAQLEVFTRTTGSFNPLILDRTIKNCARDRIQIERKPMGQLRGGYSTTRVFDSTWKLRVALREDLDDSSAYSVLCHELAHIYLGHLGADKQGGWPHRFNLPHNVAEIEAESVAHIVCRRAGVRTHSAEYLSSYMEDSSDLESISLDLVSRAAGRIEEMGRRLLPPRPAKSAQNDE